eukprot:scaffold9888_cov123-Isochrysis_galbana.AAC.4
MSAAARLASWRAPRAIGSVGARALTQRALSSASSKPRTMYDKIWDEHVVSAGDNGNALIYIDRHLVHEVTSPQAFEGLAVAGRPVRRPDCTLVTVDHNIPTSSRKKFKDVASFIEEEQSRTQVLALEKNVEAFHLPYFGMGDKRQGIVHIIGPEQGFTVPGATCVCGDSHTATHGAFGALAFGIGTSEVEHVLATSTLQQQKMRNFLIRVDGQLQPGVNAKDVVLHICGTIGESVLLCRPQPSAQSLPIATLAALAPRHGPPWPRCPDDARPGQWHIQIQRPRQAQPLGRGWRFACSLTQPCPPLSFPLGTAGGTGYTIEFAGEAIRSISMEGRMSICNMAIEAGARAGLIAPDEVGTG